MFCSPLFWQIRFLVTNLTKKNFKPSVAELNQLVDLYGHDARIFLLSCLIEETDFKENKNQKDAQKILLLAHELGQAVQEPNFASIICQAFSVLSRSGGRWGGIGGGPLKENLIGMLKVVRLGGPHQVAVLVALASPENDSRPLMQVALELLKVKVGELLSGAGDSLPSHILHSLVYLIRENQEFEAGGSSLLQLLKESHHSQFQDCALMALNVGPRRALNYSNTRPNNAGDLQAILADLEGTGTLSGYLRDCGYGCTSSVAVLRESIQNTMLPMTEEAMAEVLGLIAQTHVPASPKYKLVKSPGAAEQGATEDSTPGSFDTDSAGWNLEAIASVFREDYGSSLNWEKVATCFDHKDFFLPDLQAFAVLQTLYFSIAGKELPIIFLLTTWKNKAGQLSLFKWITTCPPNLFSFATFPEKLPALEGVDVESLGNQAWMCPTVVAALISLGDSGFFKETLEVFQIPLRAQKETLLLTLASISSGKGLGLQNTAETNNTTTAAGSAVSGSGNSSATFGASITLDALFLALLPQFFRPNRNLTTPAVLKALWELDKHFFARALMAAVTGNGVGAVPVGMGGTLQSWGGGVPGVLYCIGVMTRLIPETQGLLLNSDDAGFVAAVSCVAADKDQLNLEAWTNERYKAKGEKFLRGLCSWLMRHQAGAKSRAQTTQPAAAAGSGGSTASASGGASPSTPVPGSTSSPGVLSLESLTALLKALQAIAAIKPEQNAPTSEGVAPPKAPSRDFREDVKKLVIYCQSTHPQLAALGGAAGPGSTGSGSTDDIEEMANSYFQKIYTSEQSIGEVIVMLQRFKTSSQVREQEIFACMIHNLFDEYRFFHKYPEKELRITGVLFGTLIQHQLVSSITLGIALRYVLEALRKPPGPGSLGKMFRFGMYALEQFKGRLQEWPQYCSHIIQIQHLIENYSDLVEEIKKAMTRTGIDVSVVPPPTEVPTIKKKEILEVSKGADDAGNAPSALDRPVLDQHRALSQSSISQQGPPSFVPLGDPINSRSLEQFQEKGMASTAGQMQADRAPGAGAHQRKSSVDIGSSTAPREGGFPGLHAMMDPGRPALAPVGEAALGEQGNGAQTLSMPSRGFTLNPLAGPVLYQSTGIQTASGTSVQPPPPPTPPPPIEPSPSSVAASLSSGNTPPPLTLGAELQLGKLMPTIEKDAPPPFDPPDSVKDKVHFLINNFCQTNLEAKVEELRPLLEEKYLNWFASYLIVKRISTQPNFHSLYLQLQERLAIPALNEPLLSALLQNIAKLLLSPKIITSTAERSLLKNLGSWLGQITLAKNKPLLQRQLDMKELLFQGYETGRLIAIVPFVAKVLDGTKESQVFRPPNPWVMGLMSLLREIYDVDDLKMNIKFEVEVLCKALNLKMDEVPKGDLLTSRLAPQKVKNPDFMIKTGKSQGNEASTLPGRGIGSSMGKSLDVQSDGILHGGFGLSKADTGITKSSLGMGLGGSDSRGGSDGAGDSQGSTTGSGAGGMSSGLNESTVIPNLATYVSINPNLTAFAQHQALKRVVPVAVDRAIREIIQPVVERSVTIACITAKELIHKDFTLEPDESKMRKAAHLMVSNLAGSLALVTCKEPLRVSMGTHLRALLAAAAAQNTGQSPPDQNAVEQAVQVCSSENLELGCMLIEKAATEKALRDIDEALAPAFAARRRHREQNISQPYHDPTFSNSRYPTALPEQLRAKPGGLQPSQLVVYEAFQRVPRQPSVGSATSNSSLQSGGPSGGASGLGAGVGAGSLSQNFNQMTGMAAGQGGGGLTGIALLQQQQRMGLTATQPQLASNAAVGNIGMSQQSGALSNTQATEIFNALLNRLDLMVAAVYQATGGRDMSLAQLGSEHEVALLLREVMRTAQRAQVAQREENTHSFAQEVFKRLYNAPPADGGNLNQLRLEILVGALEAVRDGCRKLRKDITGWITFAPMQSEGERRAHCHILVLFVRAKLLKVGDVDMYVALNMDNARSTIWFEFAIAVMKQCILERVAAIKDFPNVVSGLNKASQRQPAIRKQVTKLLEDLRSAAVLMKKEGVPANPSSGADVSGAVASKPGVKPPTPGTGQPAGSQQQLSQAVRDQVTYLLEHWIRIWNESPANEKAHAQYLQVFQQQGILKTEEAMDKFFRVATELCVAAVLKSAALSKQAAAGKEAQGGGNDGAATAGGKETGKDSSLSAPRLNHSVIDAYAKLLVLLVKSGSSEPTSPAGGSPSGTSRISILNKVLTAVVRVLMQEYEHRKQQALTAVPPGSNPSATFDQRPYFRLLLHLVQDLNSPDPSFEGNNLQVLAAFAGAFHALQPSLLPALAFAWLELVAHRSFLPALLSNKYGQKGWVLAHRLLVDLFVFLEPHLRKAQLTDAVRQLYKGTLRVLLVLLHDFPEFLCDYHLSFCDVIPPSCIQLRNLVLSAFPRTMRLPDPFTPNLKVDLLPEISQPPRILSNYHAALNHNMLRESLDNYLKTRAPVGLLLELPSKLRPAQPDSTPSGVGYDVQAINALVVYVGTQAIAQLQNKTSVSITHSAPMDIFQQLANNLDPEGRYFFLNAVANQLRYPNNHTHYFSCVLLYLFAEAGSDLLKEQITRVLLERLIVHRPHPWGLLITFIELIKNPRYNFWNHAFTHCAPEIERVFESVARSCMGPSHASSSHETQNNLVVGK